jgi:hypothetical protein
MPNKDKDNLPHLEENYLDHCGNALHTQMLKAQQATQSKDKPKETKK